MELNRYNNKIVPIPTHLKYQKFKKNFGRGYNTSASHDWATAI